MNGCGSRWIYRGRTRAKCHRPAGHDGKHSNGTVQWSDTTPGATRQALPARHVKAVENLFTVEELEVVLRSWLDDDEAAELADWITDDPEGAAGVAHQIRLEHRRRPIQDVNTGGRI